MGALAKDCSDGKENSDASEQSEGKEGNDRNMDEYMICQKAGSPEQLSLNKKMVPFTF